MQLPYSDFCRMRAHTCRCTGRLTRGRIAESQEIPFFATPHPQNNWIESASRSGPQATELCGKQPPTTTRGRNWDPHHPQPSPKDTAVTSYSATEGPVFDPQEMQANGDLDTVQIKKVGMRIPNSEEIPGNRSPAQSFKTIPARFTSPDKAGLAKTATMHP